MGISRVDCFVATCGKCGEQFENSQGFSVFVDKIQAIEELGNADWTAQDGKLVCYDCWDDEEDSDMINTLDVDMS